jgi:hypothetical protein
MKKEIYATAINRCLKTCTQAAIISKGTDETIGGSMSEEVSFFSLLPKIYQLKL